MTNDLAKWVRDLFPTQMVKLSLSERRISELGSGGGGDAPVDEANRCLATDQYGGATGSTITPNGSIHLSSIKVSINAAISEMAQHHNKAFNRIVVLDEALSTNSLHKWWDTNMSPTGNLLYVNVEGYLEVSTTSLALVAVIQPQLDAINNKTYGAISPWVSNDVIDV